MNKPRTGTAKVCAQQLKEIRRACALTQLELAVLAGYSERLIRKAESGGSLSLTAIEDIAAALSTQHRAIEPDDLTASPLARTKLFMESYDQLCSRMLSRCRHIFHQDFVFDCTGLRNSRLSGVWRGTAGFQGWLNLLFEKVSRPERGKLEVEFLTADRKVVAVFKDVLLTSDRTRHEMWVNLHFSYVDGLIWRIEDQCDTFLAARLFEPVSAAG
ncbi:MAG: helix-turn-helix transcriptional regulator [Pirellulaceae bacterium]